jgi:crotonobetainyl-CoA:carnitine CoA-transferase CaiB-like acyl-CoA transferase
VSGRKCRSRDRRHFRAESDNITIDVQVEKGDHHVTAVLQGVRILEAAEQPAEPGRPPEFNEHGDAILAELGLDRDTIVDLKVRGVVA